MIEHDLLPQPIHEIATCLQEQHHEVDYYHFIEDQGGDLSSPSAKCKIVNSVYRDNLIGRLEGVAVDQINNWFKNQDHGVAAWISPMHPVYYPLDSKIIISEIGHYRGKKTLINRAIILDMNGPKCLEMAQALSERSTNRPFLKSLNAIRATPLFFDQNNWIDIMSEIIDQPVLWRKVRTGQDIKEQTRALQQAQKVYKGEIDIHVGSLSCPVNFGGSTAFRTFFDNSLMMLDRWYCRNCPICNTEIKTVVRPGEKCPNKKCNAIRQCA